MKVLLVLLDGLGDRSYKILENRTPLQAAQTARAVSRYLARCHTMLARHEVNGALWRGVMCRRGTGPFE